MPHPWRHALAGPGSEHLMELWVSLIMAGELDQMAFRGPFQLERFYDSNQGFNRKCLRRKTNDA